MPTATDLKSRQIGVPFSDKEWQKLNEYLARNHGMRKGLYIRDLVVKDLEKEELGMQKERGETS